MGLKPIKFTKVTKKYILNLLEAKGDLLHPDTKKALYDITLEEIRKKGLYLKDMKAVNFWLAKGFIEIAFYSKDEYFTKHVDTYIG